MNKKNLWFVTLFSLILILGVYYITLPNEIFNNNTSNVSSEVDITLSENNKLIALRVERDEEISTVMSELQDKIISETSSTLEKNTAFEQLQLLNLAKGKESYLEDKILEEFKIESYVEINNDNISITLISNSHNNSIANDIMRSVQEEFNDKKNITIKFNNN